MKNKKVLITGGSSGIGAVTAILFAKNGADVAITYKSNKKGAKQTVKQIEDLGRRAIAIKADLSFDKDAKKLIKKVLSSFGVIDVLVNNAGRYVEGDEWNLNSKTWIKSIEQNLVSVMSVSKYAIEHFQKQKGGIIINVASQHGICGHADAISYGASKAGVINITQAYSELLASFGGRVNSVSPSAVNTGYWLTAPKEELEKRLSRTLNHRLVEPIQVAEKILFLASEEAEGINGQNFIIE
jgi:NAD(P)-dependent dehydrogenase (short-subunit alcohol dehydrogenase family)